MKNIQKNHNLASCKAQTPTILRENIKIHI